MENMTKGQKIKYIIGQVIKILIGLTIIVYGLSKCYLSLDITAIGYNFGVLGIVVFGLYLVISAFKKLSAKTMKILKYLAIAYVAIIVGSMIYVAIQYLYN